jgi:cyclic pyranopterin monophosphate synthase
MSSFSHTDEQGNPRMVDVTEKVNSVRTARATGILKTSKHLLTLLREGKIRKGNPLDVAKIAGIMAAKNTAHLIPLCHPLALTHVDLSLHLLDDGISLEAMVTAEGKTGVEMEALTAVSVAALTLYDMCKSVDRAMTISDIVVAEKTGGRSGHYIRKKD